MLAKSISLRVLTLTKLYRDPTSECKNNSAITDKSAYCEIQKQLWCLSFNGIKMKTGSTYCWNAQTNKFGSCQQIMP